MKKRIPPRLAGYYPPVLLWLDDLEEMESLFKGWASTVKFKTASAEYDSVTELKSDVKDDEILEFGIECSLPYASVEYCDTAPQSMSQLRRTLRMRVCFTLSME